MARTYKRDALGRFAGGGGGGGRPKARPVSRGANRLTRDNAGRITSQGGAGATARGGRLRTASGKQRAVQTARIAGGGGKLRKPASVRAAKKLTGLGRAPATKLPGAGSDYYKYNAAGQLASAKERARMRGRDRAREKNAALAQRQATGRRNAERRAARRLTSDGAASVSTLRHSPTYNAAERAIKRRSSRASNNFSDGVRLERQKNSLTQKALKMQQKAAERKAQGRPITKAAEASFQQVRRQIGKIERSLATRRKAIDVIGSQSRQMEINTRNRYRY